MANHNMTPASPQILLYTTVMADHNMTPIYYSILIQQQTQLFMYNLTYLYNIIHIQMTIYTK